MLVELHIRDYAVIEDLSLELGPGLTVLTGETGAGKSIIVGALSLLLGERASSDVVRAGADRALVEGVFDTSGVPELQSRLEEAGLEAPDGLLILRRQVALEERNRAWVGGSPAPASVVGELGRALVDLHGQHEHQTLLRPSDQRDILDAFAGAEALAGEVRALHGRLGQLRSEQIRRDHRRRELEAQADFVRFQLQEIQAAHLEPGEDEALEAEARVLEHSEELLRDSLRICEQLYSGDDSVTDRISALQSVLESLGRIDPFLAKSSSAIEEAYHAIVEVGRVLGDYAARAEHDPGRLEEIRRRLDLLFRLKRKYGPELADVIETGRRLEAQLAEVEGISEEVTLLSEQIERLAGSLGDRARRLTEARRQAAQRLSREVESLLPGLGMPGAVFQVALEGQGDIGAGGAESVQFLASLNPGFEPRPLSRIASGGELSRVMLALKSILVRQDQVPSLVFDEIDVGIGGVVAGVVAEKLREVAQHHQVFVITHLPQLASRADQHLFVEKSQRDSLSVTRVLGLEGEQRVEEVARMLGGDPQSATSRAHARELLATGRSASQADSLAV